jgi:S-methylmethionine-dependent homocysteine/selenocysteine methylase
MAAPRWIGSTATPSPSARELAAANPDVEVRVNGVVGPRGDGYVVGERMRPDEAQAYHADQIGSFAAPRADVVSAITMTYPDEAIEAVDAATGGAAEAFMINCAHPTHFESVVLPATPADLAARYVQLRERLPELTILGGCCGTDPRHIAAIASAWRGHAHRASRT